MTVALLIGLAIVVALVVIAFGFVLVARRPAKTRAGPYEAARFLSPAERSFFGVLQHATRGEYCLFAKVRVADLLSVNKDVAERQGHINRIISKHVDFVLCDPNDIRPRLAIELDDSSHQGARRQQRDTFLDEAFKSAGIPLLRVPATASYEPAALADLISRSIRSAPPSP